MQHFHSTEVLQSGKIIKSETPPLLYSVLRKFIQYLNQGIHYSYRSLPIYSYGELAILFITNTLFHNLKKREDAMT